MAMQQPQTISIISISHASKVMLKILLNHLQTRTEEVIAEEQAGFLANRSMTEQIYNICVLSEKYSQHQLEIYHAFIDFKQAFGQVWHEGLLDTMYLFGFDDKLITLICQLYKQTNSTLMFKGAVGDWFHPTVRVHQGCILAPTLFNIFLELDTASNMVSFGGRNISNFRYADDIDIVARSDPELAKLVQSLDAASRKYGMEINAKNTKVMTNNKNNFQNRLIIGRYELETVSHFKYLGAISCEAGSKLEILGRTAQAASVLSCIRLKWKDRRISMGTKLKLVQSMVKSIFLYACET